MVADEDVLEQTTFVLAAHYLTVLSQTVLAFPSLLALYVTADEFTDAFIELFFLFAVDHSPHFVAFVVVKQYLFEVEPIVRLVVLGEKAFGLLQLIVEILVIIELVHFVLSDVASPDVSVLLSLLLQTGLGLLGG